MTMSSLKKRVFHCKTLETQSLSVFRPSAPSSLARPSGRQEKELILCALCAFAVRILNLNNNEKV